MLTFQIFVQKRPPITSFEEHIDSERYLDSKQNPKCARDQELKIQHPKAIGRRSSRHQKRTTSHHGKLKNFAKSFGKFGVPRPVTGSQPVTAEKPGVPQPGFLPLVMSLSKPGLAYKVGLMKPMGPLPMANLPSLMRVRMLPTTGAEAEVPYTVEKAPSTATT